jgi:Armadillo/beta-catenin-like repeat
MNYCDQRNVTLMMIHRSGGSTVKRIIPVIQQRCAEATAAAAAQCLIDDDRMDCSIDCDTPTIPVVLVPTAIAPEEECYLLAQWAVDSYYKVVIGANGGLDALVSALECFSQNALVQEYACTALAHLCRTSVALQQQAVAARVVPLLLQSTLRIHAGQVAVVAAACEVLGVLAPVWLALQSSQPPPQQPITLPNGSTMNSNSNDDDAAVRYKEQMVTVLRSVQEMYLHPQHKRTAEQLMTAFL